MKKQTHNFKSCRENSSGYNLDGNTSASNVNSLNTTIQRMKELDINVTIPEYQLNTSRYGSDIAKTETMAQSSSAPGFPGWN